MFFPELDVPIQEVRRRRPDEEGKDQDAKRIPATPFILVPSAEERLLMDEVCIELLAGEEELAAYYVLKSNSNNLTAAAAAIFLKLLVQESESRVADVHTQVTYGKEEGTAYIINGPENNVAAGSGLRALRWLRN
jgi:hypothetical protein